MSVRMTDLERARTVDDADVMRLWRAAGLPEYFLGNSGTNVKLVAFAELIRAAARREGYEEATKQAEAVIEGFADHLMQTGAEEMRERAAAECERHAKFCQEEADRGGDRMHLFIRFEEATYNAQRIRAIPLTPEEPA